MAGHPHYHTMLNIIMLKSKAILSSMRKNGEEFVNTSTIDITRMKNINRKFYSKKKNIIKERSKRNLRKKRLKIPLNIWRGKKDV